MLCRKLFCSLKKKFIINFFFKFSCRYNLCMKNGMYEEGSVDKNSVGILCCRFNLCVGITSVEKNSCRNNLCREMFCRKKFCRYLFCREKLLAPIHTHRKWLLNVLSDVKIKSINKVNVLICLDPLLPPLIRKKKLG